MFVNVLSIHTKSVLSPGNAFAVLTTVAAATVNMLKVKQKHFFLI